MSMLFFNILLYVTLVEIWLLCRYTEH